MSEKSKAEQVREELKAYTTIEDMKAKAKDIAEKIGCSKSLIYKEINKIIKERPSEALPEPREPIVKIPEAEEVEIPTEQIPTPEEIEGLPPPPEETKPEELPPSLLEEAPIEQLEEAKRLGDIFTKSMERMLNVPLDYLDLEKVGITRQEADDSAFLVLLLLGKHTNIQTSENFLEITSSAHFGSIGLRAFAEWMRKRRELAAQKAKEQKEKQSQEPKAEVKAEPKAEPEKGLPAEIIDRNIGDFKKRIGKL